MSTVSRFLFTAGGVLGTVRELARYASHFGLALLLAKALLPPVVTASRGG
jgi:hypothetical protein